LPFFLSSYFDVPLNMLSSSYRSSLVNPRCSLPLLSASSIYFFRLSSYSALSASLTTSSTSLLTYYSFGRFFKQYLSKCSHKSISTR
jgi:hypothetical protein